jgi:hypothetical protein
MVMVTKRAMASNGNNDVRDNNGNQDNSGNKDYNAATDAAAAANVANDDDDNDNKDNVNENEDKDGAVVATGCFVGSGSISGGNRGGVGGGGFDGGQVVVVVGIVLCRTTTAMCGVHNNQPEEGHMAKIPATEAKLQETTSQRNKRMRGWHNTNTSAMTARRRWWQMWQQRQE